MGGKENTVHTCICFAIFGIKATIRPSSTKKHLGNPDKPGLQRSPRMNLGCVKTWSRHQKASSSPRYIRSMPVMKPMP
jgi:hypothetical protein